MAKTNQGQTIYIRNVHNGKQSPIDRALWDKKKDEWAGHFEVVRGTEAPAEVKALEKKKAAEAATTTEAPKIPTPGASEGQA